MKKLLLTLPFAALAVNAQAGDYSYTPAPAPKQVVVQDCECQLEWFLGASAGYLTDAEEEMYHLQFGAEKVCRDSCCTHALYLEIGYTEPGDSVFLANVGAANLDLDLDAEIIPLTLNYKYECNLIDNFNWYIGAGAGVAFVDLDADAAGLPSESEDDTVFYAQIFTGFTYDINETFELFGGARYIFMDDPDLFDIGDIDDVASIDGDFLLELGLRVNF